MERKLYIAALSGSFEDITSIRNWKEQTTPTGNNILHVYIGKQVKNRKVSTTKFVEQVLKDDEGYSLMWRENHNGDTPLHLAARFGHKEAVQVFLERANEASQEEVKRMLRKTNKKNDTAVHEAARWGHVGVLKLLVESADPSDCLNEANEVGETPLYLAAERGCTASVATILDICNSSTSGFDHKGPCGRTSLHAAVQWGDSEMVQKMVEKEASLIKAQDNEGLTPLHCAAAEMSKYKLLKVLLQYDEKMNKELSSSTLYIQDNKGRTALHIAVLGSNWEAIKKLTKCRPDCVEILDNQGQNAVHYAAKSGCLVKIETLVEKQHFESLLNDKDVDGNTPLHLFAASIPKPNHACLVRLPIFIRSKNSSLDLKAFNKENLTVGDILASKLHMLYPYPITQRIRSWIAPRGKRMNTSNDKDQVVDVEKASRSAESRLISRKKAGQGQALVATLIATISFAAGFTLPGGFNQNPGDKNIGMAVLKSKTAFNIFLISDAIAFTCSTIAILTYFALVTTAATWSIESLSLSTLFLNTISLGALMLAFTTGVSVVVSQSPHLVFALWAIFMLFSFYYALLVVRNVRLGMHYLTRCSARDHHFFQ